MSKLQIWGAAVALVAYGTFVVIFHEQAQAAVTTVFTFIAGVL